MPQQRATLGFATLVIAAVVGLGSSLTLVGAETHEEQEVISVRLFAHTNGRLSAIRVDESDVRPDDLGQSLTDGLHEVFVVRLGDRAKAGDTLPDVQFICDDNLQFRYLSDAIKAVSQFSDETPEGKKTFKLVNAIKFADPAPALPAEIEIQLIRGESGAFVRRLEDGSELPAGDQLSQYLAKRAKALTDWRRNPADVPIRLRADPECPTGLVQDVIENCQAHGFENFRLSAMQP